MVMSELNFRRGLRFIDEILILIRIYKNRLIDKTEDDSCTNVMGGSLVDEGTRLAIIHEELLGVRGVVCE